MSDLVGRRGYMATLKTELDRVRQVGRGRLVTMRGRRQVGKSHLVDEVPYLVKQNLSLKATLQRALAVLVGQKRWYLPSALSRAGLQGRCTTRSRTPTSASGCSSSDRTWLR